MNKFNIGDIVYINTNRSHTIWYIPDALKIVKVNKKNKYVVIDKYLKSNTQIVNKILFEFIHICPKYLRNKKLKELGI